MTRDLDAPIPAPVWPDETTVRALKPGDEGHLHALLTQAYATGGSSIPAFGTWRRELFEDEEFDAALCFLAVDDGGRLLGAAQCWTSAFVKDLAVRADQRRKGIGRALLLTAFQAFAERGEPAVDLKVHDDNAPALAFYRSVGMTPI